jgi:long-chain fatty acid transport protein
MKCFARYASALLLLAGGTFAGSPPAVATNGYRSIGHGAPSRSMGGVGTADPQDALAIGSNPAGIGVLGQRFDISVVGFNPQREGRLEGTSVRSSRSWFAVASLAYVQPVGERFSLGIALIGSGGMNTKYRRNLYDRAMAASLAQAGLLPPGSTQTGLADTGTLGGDLNQMMLLPTAAFRINRQHVLGASLIVAGQSFEAYGLGNFQCFTESGAAQAACAPGALGPLDPGFVPSEHLTNRGHDYSYGFGARIGYLGTFGDRLTLGVAYAPRIRMSRFNRYSELFANHGRLDIPAIASVGAQLRITPGLSFSSEIDWILYSDVPALANPGPIATPSGPGLPSGTGPLGSSDGPGFGWRDQTVYKLGLSYSPLPNWTLRMGANYAKTLIPDDEILFNLIAPATVEWHLGIGVGYRIRERTVLSIGYVHALQNGQSQQDTALGSAGFWMRQHSVAISFGRSF